MQLIFCADTATLFRFEIAISDIGYKCNVTLLHTLLANCIGIKREVVKIHKAEVILLVKQTNLRKPTKRY